MQLTRRDAIAALSGAGIVVGGGAASLSRQMARAAADDDPELPSIDATLETLVAAAEAVYPSAVEGIPAFVETYSLGRIEGRESYLRGVREASATLDGHADVWFDADSFAALSPENRDALLHDMGVHTADPAVDGTAAERVRRYVVNELQYALYASPTGGELVGLENPQGHPGGTQSYQRGPR
ncbi:gluconate 2-dehydrogenase subunit 3 family protein [Halorarius halobius]|uniref:gluconate 2-dehydrogenase subunit 3 family protein n=1 Tax=Halorarius halobius TaxID=2962671 RepID=UPI0020CC63E1|nr:gluconate 2-dehydrogenase subunit 3 family protein [Halorarius halobius]